jgi:hypothetical protein
MKHFLFIMAAASLLITTSCGNNENNSKPQPLASATSTGTASAALASSSAAVTQKDYTLEVQYTHNASYTPANNNVYVIWIEDESSSFLKNLRICTRLLDGTLTGIALPYWKTNKYPKSKTAEVNAVTSATIKRADFTVSSTLATGSPKKFKIFFETDLSFNPNDWFSADQPAVLYSASVDLDTAKTEYILSAEGWTPNAGTENIIPSTPSGVLQKEMQYITNFKSGTAFGAADSRSVTNMVTQIKLVIK